MAAAGLLRHICKPQTYACLRIISKNSSYASLSTSTDIKRFSHLLQGKLIPVKIFQFFFIKSLFYVVNVILFSGLWNMHFLSIEFTLGRNGEWFIDQNHCKHDLVTIKACTFHRRHPINPNSQFARVKLDKFIWFWWTVMCTNVSHLGKYALAAVA